MKKFFAFFLLFVGLFAFNGCSNATIVSNNSNVVYRDVNSKEDLIYNMKESLENINGFNFNLTLTIKDKTYDFNGKVILKDTIENSIININYGDNSLYLKNKNVYLSYRYNNTNVIVKDSVEAFTNEVCSILHSKDKKCNSDKVLEIIKTKTLNDINYEKLADLLYVNTQEIVYKDLNASLSRDYRVTNIEYNNNHFKIEANLNYDKVSISVPIGYDLITMQIKDIKDLLKVEDLLKLF